MKIFTIKQQIKFYPLGFEPDGFFENGKIKTSPIVIKSIETIKILEKVSKNNTKKLIVINTIPVKIILSLFQKFKIKIRKMNNKKMTKMITNGNMN